VGFEIKHAEIGIMLAVREHQHRRNIDHEKGQIRRIRDCWCFKGDDLSLPLDVPLKLPLKELHFTADSLPLPPECRFWSVEILLVLLYKNSTSQLSPWYSGLLASYVRGSVRLWLQTGGGVEYR